MTILCNSGLGWPLWRAQASIQLWAFQHLIAPGGAFGDFRWAVVALLSRWLLAASNSLVETILRRAWRGARLAQGMTAADTMVAAGGR